MDRAVLSGPRVASRRAAQARWARTDLLTDSLQYAGHLQVQRLDVGREDPLKGTFGNFPHVGLQVAHVLGGVRAVSPRLSLRKEPQHFVQLAQYFEGAGHGKTAGPEPLVDGTGRAAQGEAL